MKLAIMQPYFLPYLGYFQLIHAVDNFIVYDNIEYTKKGWINRNRMLQNNQDHLFSLPLKKDSDHLHVDRRYLADSASQDIRKILAQIKNAYIKAPHFKEIFPLLEHIFQYPDLNLFQFIHHSISTVNQYLNIQTPVITSSTVGIDHNLKGKEKVLALCNHLGAQTYINPIGGMELYNKAEFKDRGIELKFHRMNEVTYPQGTNNFIKSLSIMDVMMFNSRDHLQELIESYTLD